MQEIRYGILGLGFMGRTHAMNVLKSPGVSLAAVAETDASQFAVLEEEAGEADEPALFTGMKQMKRFEDAAAMLDEAELDALIICLPTHLHEEWVCRAFEKGLHVLCEKPIALDCAAAERMRDMAKKSDRVFMVAHCLRFWPEYLQLRNTVASGELGRLQSLNLWRLSGRPDWSSNAWLLDASLSGGPIVDLHIHDVDYALFLLGRPDEFHTVGRAFAKSQNPDVVHTLFHYRNGPQVHLHAGWNQAPVPFRAGFEAWFEKGFIRFGTENDPVLEVYESGNEEPVPTKIASEDPYDAELKYFTSTIRTSGDPEACTPLSSQESLSMVLDIVTAARG